MAHTHQTQTYYTSDVVDLFCYRRDHVTRTYRLRPSKRGVGEIWMVQHGDDGDRSELLLVVDRPEVGVDSLMAIQRALASDGWVAA